MAIGINTQNCNHYTHTLPYMWRRAWPRLPIDAKVMLSGVTNIG